MNPNTNRVFTFENTPAVNTVNTVNTPDLLHQNQSIDGYDGSDGRHIMENENDEIAVFPTDAMPPELANLVREVSKAALVPESLAALNVMGILSASIGGGLLVDSGSGRETPANLFILGIAESGTGKGRSFSMIAKPFREVEAEDIEAAKLEIPHAKAKISVIEKRLKKAVTDAASEADSLAREQATRDIAELEQEKAEQENLMAREGGFSVADVTKEKLAMTLEAQTGQALASLTAEARGVLDVLSGRYSGSGSSDEDIYLSAYCRESVKVSRVNRPPVNLINPCLSVLWLIQPDSARKLLENEAMSESGLLPRFMIADSLADAEDEPENPYRADSETLANWSNLVRNLLLTVRTLGDEPCVIGSEQEAQRYLVAFTNEAKARTRKRGDLKDIAPFPRRWGENAWRLALCFHAAKYGSESTRYPLGLESAQQAVALVRWFADQQLSFLAANRGDRARKRLHRLTAILAESQGSETFRNLKKNNGFEAEEITALTATFPKTIRIDKDQSPKGGRPSLVVSMNTL